METTEGEGVGVGIPLPWWGLFFGFWGIKTTLWVIRLKITSTLAPKVQNDCSIKGAVFLVKCCIGHQGGGCGRDFCLFVIFGE